MRRACLVLLGSFCWNGILRLARINGEFFTPQQIETRFATHGFTSATTTVDAYAQLVTLHRAV